MICSYKDLGCYSHCGALELDLLALESGNHSVVWEWQGRQEKCTFWVNKGFKITVPNHFNESAIVLFQIIQPDGTYYESEGEDTFKIKTMVKYDNTCDPELDFLYSLTPDVCP